MIFPGFEGKNEKKMKRESRRFNRVGATSIVLLVD